MFLDWYRFRTNRDVGNYICSIHKVDMYTWSGVYKVDIAGALRNDMAMEYINFIGVKLPGLPGYMEYNNK